jgi:phosphotransferase system enzyme I (PtsI)
MGERKGSTQSQAVVCDEILREGVTLCPGIGIGTAHLVSDDIHIPRMHIGNAQIDEEIKRYREAVQRVIENLDTHIAECHDCSVYESPQILKVHELMAKDEQFHAAVLKRIASEQKNAEWAVFDESEIVVRKLEASADEYMQARVEDVMDLMNNIVAVLSRAPEEYHDTEVTSKDTRVLVSTNLYISHIIKANQDRIRAFATESGAFSSHAAVLLKSYGIPSVGGIKGLLTLIRNGDPVIVDGTSGLVVVRPCHGTLSAYRSRERKLKHAALGKKYRQVEARTHDGTKIQLMANISNHHQIDLALRNSLEGIGLFRTEFLILTAEEFPNEEQQYEMYRRVIDAVKERGIVIRTFDLGADKIVHGLQRCTGRNPALGVRGIRRHLIYHPEELHFQLRALLRAAHGGSVGILFPMITTVEEIIEIKNDVEKVKEELGAEGTSFSSQVKLGAMVEVPAAALTIQEILKEVDFVSVGTNDLIQYVMAADRDNEAVLHYGDGTNKAFVNLLRFMIERAAEIGRVRDVTICGEMASDPRVIPLLIEMGYRSFSISPVSAGAVREVISNIDLNASCDETVLSRKAEEITSE